MTKDIGDIEKLQLPKRTEKRRSIYLGEGIHCKITYRGVTMPMAVIDVSAYGIAMVEGVAKRTLKLIHGAKVELSFGKPLTESFKIKATVMNTSEVSISGKTFKRLGLKFETQIFDLLEPFRKQLKKEIFTLSGAIRPQAFCEDPFFFNEIVLLEVNGIFADGLELSVSARCKTILPAQILNLQIHIPGRGTFKVKTQNSHYLYKNKSDQRYKIHSRILKAPDSFYHALSEFIIMFAKERPSPKELRNQGFQVGNLANATAISYTQLSENAIKEHNLVASVLGVPREQTPQLYHSDPNGRSLTCKIGKGLAAHCNIVFVNGNKNRSHFLKYGHSLLPKLEQSPSIELVNFYIAEDSILVDFLIPLLQHAVRIGAQGRCEYLLTEATPKILEMLKRIGFKETESIIKSKINGKQQQLHLCYLPIKQVITNQSRVVPAQIWDKIYKALFQYLKKNPRALTYGKG